MKRTTFILCLILLFCSGAIVGVVGTLTFVRHKLDSTLFGTPASTREFAMRRLTSAAHLNGLQAAAVEGVIAETQLRLRAEHRKIHPQLDAILRDSKQKILVLLEPEQQEAFLATSAPLEARLQRALEDEAPAP